MVWFFKITPTSSKSDFSVIQQLQAGEIAFMALIMSFINDDSAIMEKTRELCATITADSEFKSLFAKVETFLEDDEARQSYQNVHRQGQELQQKQQAGLQISDKEITDFETLRQELFNNPVASNFMEAQQGIESLQSAVNRYLGLTLESGKVPSIEEITAASNGGDGCCGGGCGC